MRKNLRIVCLITNLLDKLAISAVESLHQVQSRLEKFLEGFLTLCLVCSQVGYEHLDRFLGEIVDRAAPLLAALDVLHDGMTATFDGLPCLPCILEGLLQPMDD